MGLFDTEAQQRFLEEEPGRDGGARQVSVRLPRHDDPPESGRAASEAPPAEVAETTQVESRTVGDDSERASRREDVVLRIATPVVAALRQACDETGRSYADVVLDAVDACWHEIDHLTPPPPERKSPLPPRTRYHRTDVGPTRQVHLLLTDQEREVLEELVDSTGAGSLTDLIERVLRHRLDVAEDPRAVDG